MLERILVAGLVVIGFGFTATNGVIAYRSAKDRLTRVGRRLKKSHETTGSGDAQPSLTTLLGDSEEEAVQRVLHALQSSRTSLLLAGVGLFISTVAAVWGLFLPA